MTFQLSGVWWCSCLSFPGMERVTRFVQNRAWKRVGSNGWGQYKGREDTFHKDAFCRNNTDLAATISIESFQDLPSVNTQLQMAVLKHTVSKNVNESTLCQNSDCQKWLELTTQNKQHRSTVQPRLESEVDVRRNCTHVHSPLTQLHAARPVHSNSPLMDCWSVVGTWCYINVGRLQSLCLMMWKHCLDKVLEDCQICKCSKSWWWILIISGICLFYGFLPNRLLLQPLQGYNLGRFVNIGTSSTRQV